MWSTVQLRGGRVALAGWLVAAVGCDASESAVAPGGDGSPTLGLERSASLEWLVCPAETPCGIRASVALREVACSAAIGCSEALLHDAAQNRRPTLVTGFSCSFPVGAEAQDALLGFHPRMRCYDAGDPADPATWPPVGGVDVTPTAGQHMFYSHADPATGRHYTDTASLLAPAVGHRFCAFEAWGFVAFSPADDAPRRLQHEQHATAIAWRGLIEPTDPETFDCHVDDGALTWVHRTVAVSITHERPDPSAKGALPASHPIVMILSDPPGGDRPAGLRAVAVAASTFPMGPSAPPEPFLERDLAVDLPGARLDATWTCPDVASGALDDVAVRVEDADIHAPLGVVIVHREVSDALGTRAWDCERDASGRCVLIDDQDALAAAPCLIPVILGP